MAKIGAGYAAVGKAKRSMIDREKKTNMWENIISDVGSAAIFAGGQIKKAKTAWKEYEAGYKELGGEDFERPKFGQKGFFKGPEGDVRIGNTMYDRSKIQEAGSFLGSDAAAVLSDDARSQYLQRTSPGTALPDRSFAIGGTGGVKLGQTGGTGVRTGFGEGTGGRFSPVVPKTVSTSGGIGVGTEFGQGTFTGNVQHELTGRDFQPAFRPSFKYTRGREATDFDQYKGKNIESGSQIDRGNLPTYEMSSKDYDRRNAYEAWTEIYRNQPTGPTEDQVNFYQNNPYRSLMETQRLNSNKQSKRPDIY